MGDAHGAVGGVDALAAVAGGAVHVDAQVLGVDGHIEVLHLRQHRHGAGAGVDAPAGFGGGHALHAVHAAFKLEAAERALAHDGEHRLLHAAQLGHVVADRLHAEAVALGVARVHAKQQRAEQRRLVAARALADLHDHVFVRVRVPGQQKQPQLIFLPLLFRLQPVDLVLGQLGHVGLAQHLAGLRQIGQRFLVGAVGLHRRLQRGMLLEQPLPAGLIRDDLRLAHRLGQFLIAGQHPVEFFKHEAVFLLGFGVGQRGETLR